MVRVITHTRARPGLPGDQGVPGTRGPRGFAGEAGYSVPEPDRTLSVVGDLHEGYTARAGNPARLDATFADLATLDGLAAHRLYVGDLVDAPGSGASGSTPGANDTAVLARITALNPDRATWDAAVGNHDLSGRTADNWATIYGYADQNWTRDLGWGRIVCIGADNITDHPTQHQTMSAATVAWLDAELASDPRDTIVVSHGPLANTTTAGWNSTNPTYYTHPNADILAVLDRHHHARAWLCGHTHSASDTFDVVTRHWTGSRWIAHINAGSPAYTDLGVASEDDPVRSMYVTVLDDRIEVRVRNHDDQAWEAIRSVYARELPRVTALPDTGNPTAFVFGLDGSLIGETMHGPLALATTGGPAFVAVLGRQGLAMTENAHRLFLDPRDHLSASQGALVVQARVGAPVTSNQYLAYHINGTASRLYLSRPNSPGSPAVHQDLSATIGGANTVGSEDKIADGDVVTAGINWGNGRMELYLNGAYAGGGTYDDMLAFANILYLGSGAGNGSQIEGEMLGVAGFLRPLTPAEHGRFARTVTAWTMDTVTSHPPIIPAANPTLFALPLNGTLDGETATGTITATAAITPTWATEDGQQGVEVLDGSGQHLHIDVSALLSPGQGCLVVRGAFSEIAGNTTSQYLIGHKTTPGDRIYLLRGANPAAPSTYKRLLPTLGDAALIGVISRVIEDDEIVTVGIDWDGTTGRMFLNGSLVGSAAYTGLTAIDPVLAFGSSNAGSIPCNNTVYAAAGFNRPLTVYEHARMALAGDDWSLATVAGG